MFDKIVRALEVSPPRGYEDAVEVLFYIRNPWDKPGDFLHIVGGLRQLGFRNKARSFKSLQEYNHAREEHGLEPVS